MQKCSQKVCFNSLCYKNHANKKVSTLIFKLFFFNRIFFCCAVSKEKDCSTKTQSIITCQIDDGNILMVEN